MAEIEIGLGKSGRRAYRLDEISIIPSRRTRDPEDVDISWQIDAYRFDIPVLGASTDSVTNPATAVRMGELGGVGVLDLEGVWTRCEDPEAELAELSAMPLDTAAGRLRELYSRPIQPDLVAARISEIAAAGVRTAGRVRPQRGGGAGSLRHRCRDRPAGHLGHDRVGRARVVVRRSAQPQDVHPPHADAGHRRGLRELSGRPSPDAHRRGRGAGRAAGSGHVGTSRHVLGLDAPQATAIADARAARMRHLDETGVYCHVIADGTMRTAGEVAKAIVCGADAAMLGLPLASASDSPCPGRHWDLSAGHPTLPRGRVMEVEQRGTLAEVLHGPALSSDGTTNLMGGLRTSLAKCGYTDVKDFQRAAVAIVSP